MCLGASVCVCRCVCVSYVRQERSERSVQLTQFILCYLVPLLSLSGCCLSYQGGPFQHTASSGSSSIPDTRWRTRRGQPLQASRGSAVCPRQFTSCTHIHGRTHTHTSTHRRTHTLRLAHSRMYIHMQGCVHTHPHTHKYCTQILSRFYDVCFAQPNLL